MAGWDRVESLVEESGFWNGFVHREELGSTSSFLRDEDLQPGTVVLAERQTGGHGRGASKWYSPEGGLWFSFTIQGTGGLDPQKLYVEILDILRDLLSERGVETSISRPNDLVVEGRKIAGVLIEESGERYVVGVGVDVNNDLSSLPDELRNRSTTMKRVTGREVDRAALLEEFLSRFEERRG